MLYFFRLPSLPSLWISLALFRIVRQFLFAVSFTTTIKRDCWLFRRAIALFMAALGLFKRSESCPNKIALSDGHSHCLFYLGEEHQQALFGVWCWRHCHAHASATLLTEVAPLRRHYIWRRLASELLWARLEEMSPSCHRNHYC